MITEYRWYNELSKEFLERDYLLPGQSLDERVDIICNTAEKILNKPGFAKQFKENIQKGWYSLSTPIWNNFGNDRGMPISCFSSYIEDSIESILYTQAEVGMMSKHGGGTSAYFGNLRPRGSAIRNNGKTSGPVHFMQLFDKIINVISQGSCYVEGTEVLTDKGFKDFRNVNKNDFLAQVDAHRNVSFTKDFHLIKEHYSGEIISLSGIKRNNSISLKVTPNHRMSICRMKMKDGISDFSDKLEIVLAKDLNLHRDNRIYLSGKTFSNNTGLSDEDRLRIAYQADGIKDGPNRKIRFHFSKKRKIDRLINILKRLNIDYITYINVDKTTDISIDYIEDIKKERFEEWINIKNLSLEWCQEFIEEISLWDGSRNRKTIFYSSTIKSNVDLVQSIASICDMKTCTSQRNAHGNRQILYRTSVTNKPYKNGDSIKITKEKYDGNVYCASVPLGQLIVRYNGRVSVCGNSRRGNFAAYLPIEHPDIEEFLKIRTEGFPIQDLSFGVTVTDSFMNEMIAGDMDKRKIWAKVLESRNNTGFPYIIFIDNANNQAPQVYKDKNRKIVASNLCSEIFLESNPNESFVCDLSSMNILYYDEWKNTNAVELLTYFLDAVMTEFIEKASKINFMERAVRFAQNQRALGIGWLGYHSYLQSKMIPFESIQAKWLNTDIAKNISESARKASQKMAAEYGEPELLKGYGLRNTTLMAIAPTKSCTTPDTKLKDDKLNDIDYFELVRRGGLDLNKIMSVTLELNDNQQITYNYNDTIRIKRNNQEISVMAYEIMENDEIL